jgi:signal recognition particle subunit SRP72
LLTYKYSFLNPSLSNELPSLEDIIANSNLDVDNLEAQFSSLSFKSSKSKTAGGIGQINSPDKLSSNNKLEQMKKKKKKKKSQLPKNIDPNVQIDPERWLPLKERSYYKGKRNKKKTGIGKGTQGAVTSK